MKLLIIVGLLTLSQCTTSQIVTDTINRLFQGKQNGDSIRARYTENQTRPWDRDKRSINKPWLLSFNSNCLAISLTSFDQFEFSILNLLGIVSNVDDSLEKSYRRDTAFYKNRIGYWINRTYDSNAVIFTCNRITKKNPDQYEFRILKNKKQEILAWSPIRLFCEPYLLYGNDEPEIAYLGEFKTTLGNDLTVDLREKSTGNIVSSVTTVWVNKHPKIKYLLMGSELPILLNSFNEISVTDNHGITVENRILLPFRKLRSSFEASDNSLLFYLEDAVRNKEMIEYKLDGSGKVQDWTKNNTRQIIWLNSLPAGKYKMKIRYSFQRHNVSEFDFEIKPAWHQTTWFKIIICSLVAGFVAFLILLLKAKSTSRKLRANQLSRTIAENELKAIRNQLNPHFVFNSLSSIQGLISSNDLEGANKYLSEFSTLMRYVLTASDKEFISLESELRTIESYLKLEQLRFKFNYAISIDQHINTSEIEVPILLIQPALENAVKHGIAVLNVNGNLKLVIEKRASDMLMSITDNGTGFIKNASGEGYGLKLINNRIELLNKVLKNQSINIEIKRINSQGSKVTLTFKNWL